MDANEGTQPNAEHALASDHSLVKQYRDGSQDAATEIYLRYAQRLRGLARAQLSTDLAKRVEIDDIVQSVLGSFFRGVNNALYQVPAGEDLWRLLLVIALHKIRTHGRYHQSAKRDTRRTTSTEGIKPALISRAEDDRAHGAFLQLVIEDTLASMSAQHRQIVEMRMDGLEVTEIAEKMGRSKRTVERLLQQARSRLSVLLDEGK